MKPKGTYSERTFLVALGNKFLQSQIITPEEEKLFVERGYKILSVPIDFREDFNMDIDRALCDFAGVSSSELSKYISGAVVQDNINPERQNPFQSDVLEIGNAPEDGLQYYNFFDLSKIPKELYSKPLCIHLDMSITGDMTGIAGTFISGKKPSTDGNAARDLYYSLGFSVSIKAPKGRQISFEKNRNFIRWLRDQGFRIKAVTADTFQSYDLIQQLQAEGFNCSTLSVDRVDTDRICKPYQSFKNALYENRFELYESKRLVEEITELERNINTGKVDHPPNGHKDVCDAVCGSMFTCSRYAEEFAYDYGEGIETTLSINSERAESQQQMTVDFEEALKEVGLGRIRAAGSQSREVDTSRLDLRDGIFII